MLLPHADPVHKVTIIPRGMALGVTMQLPVDDKHNYSREYLQDQIAILLGGRIAEEITSGTLTTGAGNDLERISGLAHKMVCEWGMSDVMGPLTFGKREEQIFLGREIAKTQDYSEDTAVRIDQEVKRFVMDNYERARTLLTAHKDTLLKIADELLAREVLDADQVKRLARVCRSKTSQRAPAVAAPTDTPRGEGGQARAPGHRSAAHESGDAGVGQPAALAVVSPRHAFQFHCLTARALALGARTLVMAIVNVTPDSFSDGGVRFDPDRAIADGVQMVADGADILDIGGESTRPGAAPLPEDEELRRVLPVIEGLRSAGHRSHLDRHLQGRRRRARDRSRARPSSTTSPR